MKKFFIESRMLGKSLSLTLILLLAVSCQTDDESLIGDDGSQDQPIPQSAKEIKETFHFSDFEMKCLLKPENKEMFRDLELTVDHHPENLKDDRFMEVLKQIIHLKAESRDDEIPDLPFFSGENKVSGIRAFPLPPTTLNPYYYAKKQWYLLSYKEKQLVKQYPYKASIVLLCREAAYNKTIEANNSKSGFLNDRFTLNDKSDAFRHAYWSALMANDSRLGTTYAILFSEAHESEVPSRFALEKQMDLFNNAVGYKYSWTLYRGKNMEKAIEQELKNGYLTYLHPINYPTSLPNKFFDYAHGITSKTNLRRTNQ